MPEPGQPAGQDRLSPPVTLAVTAVLTVLLSLWAAFLVPLRVGTVPAPVSLLLLGAVLVLGVLAGRAAGPRGAGLLALLWAAVTLPLSLLRREGDLVVQVLYGPTLVGMLYGFGGVLGWALVVGTARRSRYGAAATPRAPSRR